MAFYSRVGSKPLRGTSCIDGRIQKTTGAPHVCFIFMQDRVRMMRVPPPQRIRRIVGAGIARLISSVIGGARLVFPFGTWWVGPIDQMNLVGETTFC